MEPREGVDREVGVHRSKAVQAWLRAIADRVELHLMPGYSPELNPYELLHADIKLHVHASGARTANSSTRHAAFFTATSASHTSSVVLPPAVLATQSDRNQILST
ncbi:transposase [Streptomyces sp. CA-251387]|uniref:transposase n=1 Tax=Streptomyces sp. CA-251387 TaxID=3240064 RepID=UPI003D8CE203